MLPRVCSFTLSLDVSDNRYLQFAPAVTLEMTQLSEGRESRKYSTDHVGVDFPSVIFSILCASDGRHAQFAIEIPKPLDSTESRSSDAGHVGCRFYIGSISYIEISLHRMPFKKDKNSTRRRES